MALRLGSVPPPDRAGSVVDEAVKTTLETAYGKEAPPEGALRWLAGKVEQKEYRLFLDALDELTVLDGETPGGRGSKSRASGFKRS